MSEAYNAMIADWQGNRTAKRAGLGLYFPCSRYKEIVTAVECKAAAKPLCNECATGARLRDNAKKTV